MRWHWTVRELSQTPIPQMLMLMRPDVTPAGVLETINRRRAAQGLPPIQSKKG
jgi:hypothetical protein